VIVRKNSDGDRLGSVRVANDPLAIAAAVAEAGAEPEVVIEATYGWYWVVDWWQAQGAVVHLANPSGLNWGTRRVKNDERDAIDLVDMLRLGRLPEAWIAPPATRELREFVRYRAKLVGLRSGLKAQVHAVLAQEGVLPSRRDMFGVAGNVALDEAELAPADRLRVESLRVLIALYDREITMLEHEIASRLRDHDGYRAIQRINGSGSTMAAILVAEIGDVSRFRSAEALCSWAGLTPTHRESDTKVHRGGVTKQGSRLVRWAVIEGTVRYHGGGKLAADWQQIAERRGETQGDGRDRPKGSHARLLRPTRRRDPLPGQDRVNSSDTTRRAFEIGVPPTSWRGRLTA
jgi:transposase